MSKFHGISTEALKQQRAAAKRLLLAQQASESLLEYIRLGMPDPNDPENTDLSQYETTPQARLLCQVFEKAAKGELKRVAVSIGPQMGKLLADDTPVLTSKGWRQHGELTPGDEVHHPELGWTEVVALSEPGDASLEVRTTHGDNIAAHPRHEWAVRFGPSPEWRVIETAELANLVAAGRTVYLPPASAATASPRVWAVDYINPRPGRCIQVDAADGLYVAGRKGTVTHNSEIISRRGPAWFSAKNPRCHFMLGTYNQDFANEFGQWVRRYIRSSYHRQVFGDHRLTKGSAASDHMITELGGQLAFVGVGGSGTGKPADFFVVDDPYRNDDDARSAAYRERVWTWFNSVVFSRCHSNSSIVVVHTRWNQDDLIGRLCDPDHPERNKKYAGIADEWTYIDLPAIVKDKRLADALGLTLELPSRTISDTRELAKVVEQFGDMPMSSLWPNRKGLPFLAEARRNSPRIFDALYMGKPAPDDGDYFKAEWLHEYSADELPKALRIYAASDHALKAKEANDATCMGVVGVDERNDLWILDVRWDRMNTLDQVETMLELGRRWRPIVWWAGQDHISGSIGPFLKKRMQETGIYLHISEVSEKGDKEQKAQAFKGFAALGKVHFPRSASWWQDARKEILLFPHGAHDDFVDFLSLIGRGLNRQVAAVATKTVAPPKRGTYAHIKSLYRAAARERKVRTALAGM